MLLVLGMQLIQSLAYIYYAIIGYSHIAVTLSCLCTAYECQYTKDNERIQLLFIVDVILFANAIT